jgi:hypothetical protein
MMTGVKPTANLLSELMASDSFDSYYSSNQEHMGEISLQAYLSGLCKAKGILPGEVIRRANIDRIYGHQIMTGQRKPTREYILRIAPALRLSVEECQRLLSVSKNSRLYPRVPRDAAILYCLHNGYDYKQTQELLHGLGMTVLGEAHGK